MTLSLVAYQHMHACEQTNTNTSVYTGSYRCESNFLPAAAGSSLPEGLLNRHEYDLKMK